LGAVGLVIGDGVPVVNVEGRAPAIPHRWAGIDAATDVQRVLHPISPAAEMYGAESVIAHKDRTGLPARGESIAHAVLQGAVVSDPSLSDHFSLEIVISTLAVTLQVTCGGLDVLPSQPRVFVIGEEDHLGWIGIPLLQR